ncbi:13385_t:CDS:2, partial [Dentiscutata heterogama]
TDWAISGLSAEIGRVPEPFTVYGPCYNGALTTRVVAMTCIIKYVFVDL